MKSDIAKFYPMYTPGFAAPELYIRNAKLGPWTDIYGLGAAMFACMTGVPPPAADQRKIDDRLEQRLRALDGQYSTALLGLIAWSLQLDPLARPQSVFALQRALRAAPAIDAPRSLLGRVEAGISRAWRALRLRAGWTG